MNDFTKEELEDILATAKSYYELVGRQPENEEKLILEKLQYMIDRYPNKNEPDSWAFADMENKIRG